MWHPRLSGSQTTSLPLRKHQLRWRKLQLPTDVCTLSRVQKQLLQCLHSGMPTV